jgi:hypothetical protein
MVHRTQITNRIWTQESAYRDLSLGNLDRNIWVGDMFPLQERFDSDSQTTFPIRIDYLSAFALEQRIVGTMSISQSTAMATPFRSVPTIHNVQFDVIIKASLFKNLFEFIKRNSYNSFVSSSTDGLESFKFFNSNVGIELESKFDNYSNRLPEICIDKISFIIFNSFKILPCFDRTSVSIELKFCSPFHNLFSLNPNMLSKISLVKNLTFWGNYADGKPLSIDINTHNIFSLLDFLFFGEIGDNLQISSQTKGLAYPTVFNQISKSLIIPILFDWNSNSISWIQPKFNKEISLGLESLAVSRNIELDGQTINSIGFLLPSITNERANNLNIEGGVSFAS